MTNLEKLLVFVPIAQHDEFISSHVGKTAEQDPKYFNKIAFLQKTSEIVTHGQKYGLNGSADIDDLKAMLLNFGSGTGDTPGTKYPTVSDAIDDIVAKLNGSGLLNFSYVSGTGLTVTDTVSLTYTDGWLHLGGGTSYGTVLGKSIKIASTGADVADTTYTYVAATTAAIRDYLSSELGDIANALTFEGDSTSMKAKLDGSDVVKKDVGNLYVMETAYTLWFPAKGQTGAKKYELAAGDSVIIKSVDTSTRKVTGITTVNRALTGEVTTSSQTLTANKIVVGNGNQEIVTTTYGLGDDAKELTTTNAVATTLATEVEVANAIAKVSGSVADLNGGVTYADNYLTYSYTQTAGLVKDVAISANIATVNSSTAVVTGTGLIDATAASNIITYVTNKIDALDESYTSVDVAQGSEAYVYVTSAVSENDYTYSVGTYIIPLHGAIGMQYNEQTHEWEPASPTQLNHGLVDAVDVAQEIIADEQVIAAALNDHESRIDSLESATGGISISSGNTDALTVTKGTGLTYTITPQTAAVTSGANTLVTGAQVYSYVGGAIGGLDKSSTTVNATVTTSGTTDNGVKLQYKEDDGIVTVESLSYTEAYLGINGIQTSVTRGGLVTGAELSRVLNALDPWEDYVAAAQS